MIKRLCICSLIASSSGGGGGLPLRPLKAAIDGEVGVGGVGLLQCPDYERQFAKQRRLSQHGQSAHTEEYRLTNVPKESAR